MSHFYLNKDKVPNLVQRYIKELIKEYDAIEKKIVHLALKYEICVTLGEDKQGSKQLITSKEEGSDGYKDKGDWLSSYESCH
jgi:hypothetical protein